MTLASAKEIASVVIPMAIAEHRVKMLGRTNWGVTFHNGKLERDHERCRICPLAAYLLSKNPDPIAAHSKSDGLLETAAHYLSIDTGKKVTRNMMIGFTNKFDGLASIMNEIEEEDRIEVQIGRDAAEHVNVALKEIAS